MNKVSLVGRLTKNVEVRYTDGGNSIAKFSLAIERRFKKEGEQKADFISIIAFGKVAEFIEKYFCQGNRIGISGRIQSGNYINKDGQKIFTTDVVVEEVEFVESKHNSNNDTSEPIMDSNEFLNIGNGFDENLPFD